MFDVDGCLPKNFDGIRTIHTCELCGFEPKTKNKYREKQDHLVMKHFKQKIDKIFPQTRPYNCPTEGCGFTGKDKQALLRHYTGKHGILERYLKEALAENGIQFLKTEQGSKRKCSVSLTPSAKIAKQAAAMGNRLSKTVFVDPIDLLPKQPLPMVPRPNTEELKREVQALMASLQPTTIILNVTADMQIQTQQQTDSKVCQTQQQPIKVIELPVLPDLCSTPGDSLELPNGNLCLSPEPNLMDCCFTPLPRFELTTPMSQSTMSSVMGDDDDDDLPMTPSLPTVPIPPELLASQTDSIYLSAITSPSLFLPSPVIDNKEVMWGSGPAGEAFDTIPTMYIENAEGNYSTMLEAIDCDLLMPSIQSLEPMKEKQIDFCTY